MNMRYYQNLHFNINQNQVTEVLLLFYSSQSIFYFIQDNLPTDSNSISLR